ncbi:MAG: hypothetical protein ACRYG8_16860 [Janthinobacterium lividum]
MFGIWHKMLAMLQSGLNVGGVTHRLDVQKYPQGFKAMMSGSFGKVVLDWTAAC